LVWRQKKSSPFPISSGADWDDYEQGTGNRAALDRNENDPAAEDQDSSLHLAFPGIILYLTYWFRRREQAPALALSLIGIPIASIVGAPLSGPILDHAHCLGLGSWRWLLILEGIPPIVGGVLACYLLPIYPAEARFLAEEEKDWIIQELKREEQHKWRNHPVSATRALLHSRGWHLTASLSPWALLFTQQASGCLKLSSPYCPGIPIYGGTSGDDFEYRRVAADDCHFPEVRSQAGAEMARGDSCTSGELPACYSAQLIPSFVPSPFCRFSRLAFTGRWVHFGPCRASFSSGSRQLRGLR
jgi:hypothetical protein